MSCQQTEALLQKKIGGATELCKNPGTELCADDRGGTDNGRKSCLYLEALMTKSRCIQGNHALTPQRLSAKNVGHDWACVMHYNEPFQDISFVEDKKKFYHWTKPLTVLEEIVRLSTTLGVVKWMQMHRTSPTQRQEPWIKKKTNQILDTNFPTAQWHKTLYQSRNACVPAQCSSKRLNSVETHQKPVCRSPNRGISYRSSSSEAHCGHIAGDVLHGIVDSHTRRHRSTRGVDCSTNQYELWLLSGRTMHSRFSSILLKVEIMNKRWNSFKKFHRWQRCIHKTWQRFRFLHFGAYLSQSTLLSQLDRPHSLWCFVRAILFDRLKTPWMIARWDIASILL